MRSARASAFSTDDLPGERVNLVGVLTFDWPTGLTLGGALAALSIAIVLFRRPPLPRGSVAFGLMGITLVALAAGEPVVRVARRPNAVVLVDVSPSTRGASFRDAMWLRNRVAELLPDTPARALAFAGEGPPVVVGTGGDVAEISSGHTTFSPPADADAVLLFSDGRFRDADRSAALSAPVYAVVDAVLDEPTDTAIENIELLDERSKLLVTTRAPIGGEPRSLELTGLNPTEPPRTIRAGAGVESFDWNANPRAVSARLTSRDPWPENDALSFIAPPPLNTLEKWWVSTEPPAGDAAFAGSWTHIRPNALPEESSAYLRPSVIALDNVHADALTDAARDHLALYVSDMGGALLLLGGDRAFAAGAFHETRLEELSPLSSVPPEPRTHWIVLVDASGSMAGPVERLANGGATPTRWSAAGAAVSSVIPALPRADYLSIGAFSRDVRWMSPTLLTTAEAAGAGSFFERVLPQGPTNLDAALRDAATRNATAVNRGAPALPAHVLLLTDGDARLDDPTALAATLGAANVRLNVMATAPLVDTHALRTIAAATGGLVTVQAEGGKWMESLRQLYRATSPSVVEDDPALVTFDPGQHLPPRTAMPVNRVWPKPDAQVLATTSGEGGRTRAVAARWRYGLGEVAAIAFRPTLPETAQFVREIERRPRDPRFDVTWNRSTRERGDPNDFVLVDAYSDPQRRSYLTDARLMLETLDGRTLRPTGEPVRLLQTAPGRYLAELAHAAEPRVARVILVEASGARSVIDRAALAGRYSAEFDRIGNDRITLRQVAEGSGGRLIEPNDRRPISLPARYQRRRVGAWVALAGAVNLALALVRWRRAT